MNMEYIENKKEIILNRELNELDKFVIDFTSLLDHYVLVSGYVSILFGRSRATEDVDLLIPKIDKKEFEKLWKKVYKNGFECLNTNFPEKAFQMMHEHAIRFSRKGKPVPNMEFKMIKNEIDEYSLNNQIKAIINSKNLFISPLEMQIAYKLHLGSEKGDKDIEDARHLYKLFKENLNKEKLSLFIEKLKSEKKFEWIK